MVTTIGAMTAAAGGLDVLVFTGGVGQNSASVRAEVSDRDIGVGVVRVLVIEAREDLQMVREVSALRAAERPG